MFSSSHSSRSSSYGVMVDVGSGSVGVGIVHSSKFEDIPTIIYAHREYIKIGERPTPDERVRSMRQALFSAMLVLSDTGLRKLKAYDKSAHIDTIEVICAAPWSKTVTRTIQLQKDKPFLITEDWVADLVEKAEKQDPSAKHTDGILKDLGMEVVEKSIVDVKVNGYTTTNPYGNEGTEISIAHTTGLVPNEILRAIDEVEDNILTDVNRIAHTYALVLYCVLRDQYPEVQNALIVDVTGEATEVGIMKDGVLMDTVLASHGTLTLTRATARALNTIPEEAKAYIASFKDTKESDQTYTALAHAAKEYESALESVFTEIREHFVLPMTLFVTIDPEVEDYFMSIITPLHRRLTGQQKTTVIPIGPKKAKTMVNFENDVHPDAFLSVAARFFHKLHGCGESVDER